MRAVRRAIFAQMRQGLFCQQAPRYLAGNVALLTYDGSIIANVTSNVATAYLLRWVDDLRGDTGVVFPWKSLFKRRCDSLLLLGRLGPSIHPNTGLSRQIFLN